MLATVVICTHNPRLEYLREAFDALRSQTLPVTEWELVLVDNASAIPLANRVDLCWHPAGRHVREEQLGLTPARRRGIHEANGELLVFVDDDNVLAPTYLATAVEIGQRFPFLGIWGGSTIGRFETPPPVWAQTRLEWIAVRQVTYDVWSNVLFRSETTPTGAGMVVRRAIAQAYNELLETDPARQALDRCGQNLISGGDTDLSFLACHLGFGSGLFTGLSLEHIIPAGRFALDYYIRLAEGLGFSGVVVNGLWGQTQEPPPHRSPLGRVVDFIRQRQLSPEERQLRAAYSRGRAIGIAALPDYRMLVHSGPVAHAMRVGTPPSTQPLRGAL